MSQKSENQKESKKRIKEGTPLSSQQGTFVLKRPFLVLGILIVLILIIGFLFLNEKAPEEDKKPENAQQNEQEFKEKTGYDERLRKTIQEDSYVNNQGTIMQGYKYNDLYYLTLNQSGVYTYNDSFPGDILLWVKEEDGKVETKQINGGDKLTNVVEIDDSPYLKQDGRTYFIYYENNGNAEMGFLPNGFVYEIKEDGSLSKHYETKGHFHSLNKDKNGTLVLVEKVFLDSLNMYPSELKPYKLKSYRLENNEWVFLSEKEVTPVEEENRVQDGA